MNYSYECLRFVREQLRIFPTDITFTIAISYQELRSRRHIKLINYAISQEHTLAYRFNPSYDRDFHAKDGAKLVAQLSQAKKMFMKQNQYELKYTFFPLSTHSLKKQVKAVEEAGYKVFGSRR